MGTNLSPRTHHPWHGGICDFHFDDGEESGVITLRTRSRICKKAFDKEYDYCFQLLKKGPGVYKDREIGLDNGENCYTIYIEDHNMKPGIVRLNFRAKVMEFNERFDKDLEVHIPDNIKEKILWPGDDE